MTVTNVATGQQYNMATLFNTKLEAPIIQSEMDLDAHASASGQAVRWDEFSKKHNNDGTFKGIDQSDMSLSAAASATKQAVRYDEFSARHNNNGTVKQQMFNKSSNANPSATANTYGNAITNSPPTNFTSVLTLGGNLVFGGTWGSGETVTVQITFTFSDGTTASITKTASSTGIVTLSTNDFLALVKDGVYITQTSYQSQSNIANSAATVLANHYGMYL